MAELEQTIASLRGEIEEQTKTTKSSQAQGCIFSGGFLEDWGKYDQEPRKKREKVRRDSWEKFYMRGVGEIWVS